jgi:hypothetical protein
MAQHWLDFLLESWPEDWSALLLYANVVHMIGDMKNDRATLTRAVALYEKYIDKEGEKDAEAHMQYARCLASLYLFDGKSTFLLLTLLKTKNMYIYLRDAINSGGYARKSNLHCKTCC